MLKYSCVFLLFCVLIHAAICIKCTLAQNATYVTIKSKKTGLVFDGSVKNLVVAESTGSDAQKWILKCNGLGPYYIRNKKTNHVVDLQAGCGKTTNLITYPYHGGKNQIMYFNSDNTIGTACDATTVLVAQSNKNVGLGNKNAKDVDATFIVTKA